MIINTDHLRKLLAAIFRVSSLDLNFPFDKNGYLIPEVRTSLNEMLRVYGESLRKDSLTEIENKQFTQPLLERTAENLTRVGTLTEAKIAFIYCNREVKEYKGLRFDTKYPFQWWDIAVEHLNHHETLKANDSLAKVEKQSLIPKDLDKKLTPIWTNNDLITSPEKLRDLYLKFDEAPILILEGLGGSGKSALANLLLHAYFSDFVHVAWLEVEQVEDKYDPRNSQVLFDSFEPIKVPKGLRKKKVRDEEFLKDTLAYLKTIDGKSLLVIDNANASLSVYWNYLEELVLDSQWMVIITSRYRFQNPSQSTTIDVSGLDNEAAFKVYLRYRYGTKTVSLNDSENNVIEKLIKSSHGHPLIIKLFALLAKRHHFNADELEKLLEKEGLLVSKTFEIEIENNSIDPANYILKLFPLIGMLKNIQKALIFFSIQHIEQVSLMHIKELSWEISIGNTIRECYDFGWLDQFIDKNDGSISYGMHGLIRDIIRYKHPIDMENSKNFIIGFMKATHRATKLRLDGYLSATYLDYAIAILNSLKSQNTEPTILYFFLIEMISDIYFRLDDIKSAIYYSNMALELGLYLKDNPKKPAKLGSVPFRIFLNEIIEKILNKATMEPQLEKSIDALNMQRISYYRELIKDFESGENTFNVTSNEIIEIIFSTIRKPSLNKLTKSDLLKNHQNAIWYAFHYRKLLEHLYQSENFGPDLKQFVLIEIRIAYTQIEDLHRRLIEESPELYFNLDNPILLQSYMSDGTDLAKFLLSDSGIKDYMAVIENRYSVFHKFLEMIFNSKYNSSKTKKSDCEKLIIYSEHLIMLSLAYFHFREDLSNTKSIRDQVEWIIEKIIILNTAIIDNKERFTHQDMEFINDSLHRCLDFFGKNIYNIEALLGSDSKYFVAAQKFTDFLQQKTLS
ncbi:MAG: NB-ARC domain-containing protein [Bacteroidota bacterium]